MKGAAGQSSPHRLPLAEWEGGDRISDVVPGAEGFSSTMVLKPMGNVLVSRD
jgi:hypothetical protein